MSGGEFFESCFDVRNVSGNCDRRICDNSEFVSGN